MAPGDEIVVRRLAALLLVEIAADPGGDRVEEARLDRVLALLRGASEDAARFGSKALVAGFDRPAAAVAAATRLHRVLADAEEPPCRAGLHVGEIIMTADGLATRAAVEHVSALALVARPGSTAVEAAALPAIGPLRGVRVETPPPAGGAERGISLLVPQPSAPWRERRRLIVAMVAAAALTSAAAWLKMRPRDGVAPHAVILGVGPFRSSRTDPEHSWIGAAVRGGLSTQLSQLSGVKVYSQEFLDFLMSREGLSEIEVATRLGIEKMLIGAVLVIGDSVRLEARIVDVASGLLEGSHSAVGRQEDFLALENEVVLGVIGKLHLPLSADDERRLAARRASDPEAFRRLLDIEGGSGSEAAPPPGDRPDLDPRSDLLAPRLAFADDDSASVSELLERYRRVTEAGDIEALGGLHVAFSADQRRALERYFANVRDLRVAIADVDVAVVGEEAVVSFTRTDEFVDVTTGRPTQVSLRATRKLRRQDGAWRFEAPR